MDVPGGDAGFVAPGNGVQNAAPSEAQLMLNNFWTKMAEEIRTMNQVTKIKAIHCLLGSV